MSEPIHPLEYAELKRKYEALELRVARFSSIEQELLLSRNRLDREIMIHRQIQQFNSGIRDEITDDQFLDIVTENLIGIFEQEVGFVSLESTDYAYNNINRLIGYELSFQEKRTLQITLDTIFKNNEPGSVLNVKDATSSEVHAVIPFSSFIMTRMKVPGTHITITLLGGITRKGDLCYEPIQTDRQNAFMVFAQQVVSHKSNRNKNKNITRQSQILAVEQKRTRSIAETLINFGTSAHDNIEKILYLTRDLFSAELVVYENLAKSKFLFAGDIGSAKPDQDKLPRSYCSEIMQASGQHLLIKQLGADSIAGMKGWIEPFEGSFFIGITVQLDANAIGTLALFTRDILFTENEVQIIRILSASIAVEERRAKAAMELSDSEERYRLIFDGTPSGIIALNIKTLEIEYANRAGCTLFGYAPDEFAGLTVDKLHPPEFGILVHGEIGKMLRGESSIANAMPCRKKNGELFYADISSGFIQVGDKKMIVGFFTDITEQKAYRESIINKNAELTRINTELDNFVYSISHDLRSPVLAIKGLTELALQEGTDAEKLTYLDMIVSSANRMDVTIQEILDYSRNARLDIQASTIDLKEMIHSAFNDVKFIARDEVALKLAIKGSGIIRSDKNRIEAVCKNIISNAIKYRRRDIIDPWLHVSATVSAQEVIIGFEDNGEGISEEYMDDIFKMFFRASNSASGTGLGLYICKQIMDILGGTITVTSQPGSGSIFTIRFNNLSSNQ